MHTDGGVFFRVEAGGAATEHTSYFRSWDSFVLLFLIEPKVLLDSQTMNCRRPTSVKKNIVITKRRQNIYEQIVLVLPL